MGGTRANSLLLLLVMVVGASLPWSGEAAAKIGGKHQVKYRERLRKESLQAAGIDVNTLSAVKVLNSANFSRTVPHQSKYTIVEFYTPWCSHCKKLAPIWELFAQKVNQDPRLRAHVVVANVNVDASADIGELYDVDSFPTLLVFNPVLYGSSSAPKRMASGHELEDLIRYTKNNLARPPVKQRIYAFDLLAKEFYNAGGNSTTEGNLTSQQEIHDRAMRSAEHFTGQKHYVSGLYVKLMNKAITKGNGTKDFFNDEMARLQRMISTGTLGEEKDLDMFLRQVIVESFRMQHRTPGIAGLPEDAQRTMEDEFDSDSDSDEDKWDEASDREEL